MQEFNIHDMDMAFKIRSMIQCEEGSNSNCGKLMITNAMPVSKMLLMKKFSMSPLSLIFD
jgi:hypothetical protein